MTSPKRIELRSHGPHSATVTWGGLRAGTVRRDVDLWNYCHWSGQRFIVCDVDPHWIPDPYRIDEVPGYVRSRLQGMFDKGEITV